ncbi:hypothetical protein ACNGEM_09080 [Campylobacter coli]
MQFKKVDVLITENLTKEQLKEKVLTELNKISKQTNPRISYIANIHDIVNGKYWICMDSETKENMEAEDELIDLQAIFRHTTENPEEASKDLLYSSKYIEDNFLRKIIFETYKEANDSRLTKLETTVGTNEKDIEDKHYKLEKRVTTAENTITTNKELEDTRYSEYTQFKKNIENNILGINNNLNTKANLGGSETQVFNVADPTSDWHAINLAYAKKNFNADLINVHIADFNNPHRTTVRNLNDTTITDPQSNQALVYNGTKWVNKSIDLDDSNYAQLTANNTFTGNNVFNNAVTGGNATKDNHLLNRVTADGRYSKILVKNINWTVGTGGNFSKLSDALSEACKYITINGTYKIVITLKSGYKLNEKISLVNSLASHIIITSQDDKVNVDYDPQEGYLFDFKGCIAPQLSCLFDATGTTAKGISFINSYAKMIALNSNKHKFGFINLKMKAIAVENSKVVLYGYNLSENGKNLDTAINQEILFVQTNSELTIVDGKFDNNGSLVNGWLYYCGYNSRLSVLNGSFINNKTTKNIFENNNSYINAQYSNFTGSRGNYLLRSFNGAQTNLNGINTASCTWSIAELPFTVNTVTKDGIIYK